MPKKSELTEKKKTVTKKTVAKKETAKKEIKTVKKVAEKKDTKTVKKVTVKKEIVNPVDLALKTIVEAIQDKKGKNVCTLNLTKIGTSICDYFVICNADSTTNVLAISDNIEDELIKKCKLKPIRQQGKENAFWIIMDYGDIVIHIFQTEYREFYRLEDLWSDAIIKTYQD